MILDTAISIAPTISNWTFYNVFVKVRFGPYPGSRYVSMRRVSLDSFAFFAHFPIPALQAYIKLAASAPAIKLAASAPARCKVGRFCMLQWTQ
ncbi:hypothetical protein DS909_07605 [Phaeobacter gallaeciensis]|uniref:Uncharacterized protein n=1 Tax=Phaeobacter gallaeciensis TaxID=60890 RepID=A0A366X2C0_9RHOB|nr:hypothetical protein DS909_07605 [Phaeobacter gallaeciensis]